MPKELAQKNPYHEDEHYSAQLGRGGLATRSLDLDTWDVSATNVSYGQIASSSLRGIIFDGATTAQRALKQITLPEEFNPIEGDLKLIVKARLVDAGSATPSGEGLDLLVGSIGAGSTAVETILGIDHTRVGGTETDMDTFEVASGALSWDDFKDWQFDIRAAQTSFDPTSQQFSPGSPVSLSLGPKSNVTGTLQIEVVGAWLKFVRHVGLHNRDARFE